MKQGWFPDSALNPTAGVFIAIAIVIGGDRISDVLMWHAALGFLLMALVVHSDWPRDRLGNFASGFEAQKNYPQTNPSGWAKYEKLLTNIYCFSVFLSLPMALILKYTPQL